MTRKLFFERETCIGIKLAVKYLRLKRANAAQLVIYGRVPKWSYWICLENKRL